MTDVAEIATRAERGDDAGELLRGLAKAVWHPFYTLPVDWDAERFERHNTFDALLAIKTPEAHLAAAMMLVPEGKEWTLDCLDAARDPRFGCCQARIHLMAYADDPEELGPQAIANGPTPAHALIAAIARSMEHGD